jgi:hypothetical protein
VSKRKPLDIAALLVLRERMENAQAEVQDALDLLDISDFQRMMPDEIIRYINERIGRLT